MSPESSLIQLSNFTSLFEVAIGLNLVFAVWDTLRKHAVNKFIDIGNHLETELELNLGARYRTSRCATKFSEKYDGYIKNLEILAKFGKCCGLSISIVLVFVLVNVGYDNTVALPLWAVNTIVLAAVGISPLILIVGNLYVIQCRKSLDEFKQAQTNAIADVQQLILEK